MLPKYCLKVLDQCPILVQCPSFLEAACDGDSYSEGLVFRKLIREYFLGSIVIEGKGEEDSGGEGRGQDWVEGEMSCDVV